MAVLVDTNVILDVLTDDPRWRPWSQAQLARHRNEGLAINGVIFAELSIPARDLAEVEQLLLQLELDMIEVPRRALFSAGKAFARYRAGGGTKSAPLPDFFIGAHAEAASLPLVTRDPNRYRTYFPSIALIAPEP